MLINFEYLKIERPKLDNLQEWKEENGLESLGPGFVDVRTGEIVLKAKLKENDDDELRA